MRSHKASQSSVSTVDSTQDQSDRSIYGQADGADPDVMCLVYPDGRIMTVEPNPKTS